MRYLLLFLLFTFPAIAFAQKPRYIDFKPQYQEWNSRYILDKITYWKDRTVFHFRYAAGAYKAGMTFYGPLDEINRWCLVNTANPAEQFPQTELRKIVREGYVIYGVFRETKVYFSTKPYEIYTVEVHFPALPSHVTQVDFLEGVSKRSYSNHFHCFDVRIKPFDDPELGSSQDMKKRIDAFEIKTLGWAKTALAQPTPKEIEVVEKKPVIEKIPEKIPEKITEKIKEKITEKKAKPSEAQAQGKDVFAF